MAALKLVGGVARTNPAIEPVPAVASTSTVPLTVPTATTAVTCVAEIGVTDVAAMPPKRTAVAPVRFVPVIVTVCPMAAGLGAMPVTVGGGVGFGPIPIPRKFVNPVEKVCNAPAPVIKERPILPVQRPPLLALQK